MLYIPSFLHVSSLGVLQSLCPIVSLSCTLVQDHIYKVVGIRVPVSSSRTETKQGSFIEVELKGH